MLSPRAHRSVLSVEGTLRAPVSSELRRNVQSRLVRGERRILLDLSRLSSIDAAGVGELIGAFNTTTAAGGVLEIAHPRRHVRQLLHTVGVLNLLTAGATSDRCA